MYQWVSDNLKILKGMRITMWKDREPTGESITWEKQMAKRQNMTLQNDLVLSNNQGGRPRKTFL